MPITGPLLDQPVELPTLLRNGLAVHPDAPALTSVESRWNWRDLDQISNRLASGLLSLGLRPGDRVASLMPNRPALLAHYLACFKAGLVSTPLNYRYQPPEIDHALRVSGASALLVHAERDADVAASTLANRLPRGIIHFDADKRPGPSFEELTDPARPVQELTLPDPTAPAVVFFTSGSTGLPKGVTHTGRSIGWILASIGRALEYTPNDVVLPGSSHSHIGGMMFSLAALAAGARVVVPRTIDSGELLPLLRHERPTVFWMLPAALFGLVRDHDARTEDFRTLRLCFSGGDTVPAELEREFTDLTGQPIREGYGMTEIGHATNNPPSGLNKLGSIGVPNPGYTLSIRTDDGTEVSTGEGGRVWVQSPCNTVGYWDNPTATAETIQDGWLDTGDVMRADDDGYLWFEGRKKQIIVHDGSNICPQEVEGALLEHPAVASAGVVGVHDLVHGETVHAYVTLQEGAPRPTGYELVQFARARVGYKAPESVVVLSAMPVNATGKVDRMALKRMAEAAG